jgi:hypothetical protein
MSVYYDTEYVDAEDDRAKYDNVKYDEKGNWVERIVYDGKIPVIITERTIEYYE